MDIDSLGHELQHKRPDGIIEEDGTLVLVQDIEAKTDGPFKLSTDGGPVGEIPGEKIMVDDRVFFADIEGGRVVEPAHGLLELLDKFIHGEAQGLFLHIEHYAWEMLRRLNIHILIIAEVRQLRPEGHIQGQGEVESLFNIGLGHDRHGCGQEVSGDRHDSFLLEVLVTVNSQLKLTKLY